MRRRSIRGGRGAVEKKKENEEEANPKWKRKEEVHEEDGVEKQ